MKKIDLPRILCYILGNIGIGVGTAVYVKIHLGLGVKMATGYALARLLPAVSIGDWTILFNGLFFLAAVLLTRKIKIAALFSFLGSVILGKSVDIALFYLHGFAPQNYYFRCGLLLVALFCNGLAVALLVMAKMPANPMILLELEITDRVKKLTYDQTVNYVNYWTIGVTVLVGVINWLLHNSISSFTWHSVIDIAGLSGIWLGTLISALFFGRIIKIWLIILRPWLGIYNDLSALHINLNYNCLRIFYSKSHRSAETGSQLFR